MTTGTSEGARVLGSLRSADGAGVVHIEQVFQTGVDDLWSALTDPARLARWYGQVDGELRPGGKFRLWIESDGWEGTGRVEECQRPHRLVVTTRESEESWLKGQGAEPFDGTIEATLHGDDNRILLVIEVRGLPLDKIAFYGAGWQIHVENLADHVGGRERRDTEARWDELVPPYQRLAAAID
jgi:uncharacterized protein YndB with AHSA1/START domain